MSKMLFFSGNSNSDIFGILCTYFVNRRINFRGEEGACHRNPSFLLNIKRLAKKLLAENPVLFQKGVWMRNLGPAMSAQDQILHCLDEKPKSSIKLLERHAY